MKPKFIQSQCLPRSFSSVTLLYVLSSATLPPAQFNLFECVFNVVGCFKQVGERGTNASYQPLKWETLKTCRVLSWISNAQTLQPHPFIIRRVETCFFLPSFGQLKSVFLMWKWMHFKWMFTELAVWIVLRSALKEARKGGFVQMFEVTHLINDNTSKFCLMLQTCLKKSLSEEESYHISLMLSFKMTNYDSNKMKCDWTPSRYWSLDP